jgi:hypothetical protein
MTVSMNDFFRQKVRETNPISGANRRCAAPLGAWWQFALPLTRFIADRSVQA